MNAMTMLSPGRMKLWIGTALLISVISFSFYKSSVEEPELNIYKRSVEDMQRLQIQLHRDLLNYRSGSVYQYDTLNDTHKALLDEANRLANKEPSHSDSELNKAMSTLMKSLTTQQTLVEDFKMHHSILQNSMSYYSRLTSKLYSEGQSSSKIPEKTLGNLSRLILDYIRQPENKTALKLYADLDKLNVNPSREVKTLINHSLLIIEKLPDIDSIIARFSELNVEGQLQSIFQIITDAQQAQERHATLYNLLMYTITLALLAYLFLTFLSLQKSKDTLSTANLRLNKEVSERTRTETALMKFVTHITHDYTDDQTHCILNALAKSLDVRYAQIITLDTNSDTGASADIIDNHHFSSDVPAEIIDTADEDALARGRLAYNDELQNYFPATKNSLLEHAVSYIGLTLKSSANTERLIAIADDKPIDNISLYENILSIAASRITIELSRKRATDNSIRYQQGLGKIDRWVAQLISHSNNRKAFIAATCDAARDISNATLSALCEVTPDRESYVYSATSGEMGEALLGKAQLLKDGGLCAWTINYNESVCINDLPSDIRAKRKLVNQLNIQHAIVAPITLGEEVYGCLVTFRDKLRYDEIDQQLLAQFCQSMEIALNNQTLLGTLQSQKERAEVTLHSIADAVITTDAAGNIDYMNHVAENLSGWSIENATHQRVQKVFKIIDPETHEPQHKLADACLYDGVSIKKSTTTLITEDGTEREIECSMSPIKPSADETDGIVIVFHDETERRRMEYFIKHQASHDALTGLLNRAEFIHQLNDHIFDSRDTGRIHVACYLDLDRFKLVNDTAGHSAGDELLTEITRIIDGCIRSGDVLARLGGDEFGLILQNCSIDSATHIANKIVGNVNEYSLEWEGQSLSVGISIGLTMIDANTLNATEATRQADVACYTAKDHGRNRVYIYQRKDTELLRREEESRWVSRITEALNEDRFILYAQPICPLKNNKIDRLHLEVLVRMHDSNGKLIAPNAFIPAAERYGQMSVIDQHIIMKTFEHITSQDDTQLCYSINLSGNSLNDENLSQLITDQINAYDIDPSRLCFEITETAAITNLINTRQLIDDIKKLGCSFALDDFGSGLSSFEYLKNLPVDYLKIDGSFVRDMANNKIDHAMVAAINQIGHIMDIKTIAEFAESDSIMRKLQKLNVDFAQGYGIARPIPIEDINIDELINRNKLIKRRASNA